MAFVADPQQTNALLALLKGAANFGQPQNAGYQVPSVSEAPAPPANWEQMVDPNTYVQQVQGPQIAPQVPVEQDIVADGKELIRNKGAFGVKGTLRDILGYLGDGLTGRNAYSQLRKQERFGNILAGKYVDNVGESFAQNPMLAIQRLAEEGFGNEAAELLQQVRQNEIANRRATAQESRDERNARSQEILGQQRAVSIVSSLLSNVRDDLAYQRIRGTAANYLKNAGLEELANTLPPAYEPSLNRWGIQNYQANRLDDYDIDRDLREQIANAAEAGRAASRAETARHNRESESISQQNADSNTTRANKAKDNRKAPSSSPIGNALSTALSAVPPAPRKAGDRITGPDGSKYTSPDGKRWVKQ